MPKARTRDGISRISTTRSTRNCIKGSVKGSLPAPPPEGALLRADPGSKDQIQRGKHFCLSKHSISYATPQAGRSSRPVPPACVTQQGPRHGWLCVPVTTAPGLAQPPPPADLCPRHGHAPSRGLAGPQQMGTHLPAPVGCPGLSGRAVPPSNDRSHTHSWRVGFMAWPARASWALFPPLNSSLKTPSSVRPVPIARRRFTPTPAFPPPSPRPPPAGRDVPTWPCMPQAGWERPRSHGMAA